jgi:hypothetical protein
MTQNSAKFTALLVITGALALAQDRGAIRGTITEGAAGGGEVLPAKFGAAFKWIRRDPKQPQLA